MDKKLTSMLKKSGFKSFFHVKVRKTNFFANYNQMDWLIGEWVFAYLGNVTNDEILNKYKTILMRLNSLPKKIDIMDDKWPIKSNNLKVLPVGLEYDDMDYYEAFDKFAKLKVSRFFNHDRNHWFLNMDENINIIEPLYFKFNLELKFKKIKI